MPNSPLDKLRSRPGFLIRRAHQVAVSVFLESMGDLNVTPTKFGLLHLIRNYPDIDQASAARALGIDRSTAAMVLRGLEKDGYVVRVVGADKRRLTLQLSDIGKDLCSKLEEPASAAVTRLLSPLEQVEQIAFLHLLEKLTNAFNRSSRVPLMGGEVD